MRKLLCLFCLGAWALAQPSYPLNALEPGQTGYGLTAGPGNLLEPFEVVVLGVQHDAGLGFPLVLVRASGEVIEAAGGVAAGMSGSPVYLPHRGEDALLGAVSYVFPNSDHSLALVTPIEVMRGELEPEASWPEDDLEPATLAALGPYEGVRSPLLMTGLSERAAARLAPLFASSGLEPFPVQLGGVGGFDEAGYRLEPGSAVSVQLVRGDVTIAVIGTVTSLERGGRVLAFGHPILGEGSVSFALAPAMVTALVSSTVMPFKLANSGQTVLGAVTEDRPAAVAGRLGATPELLGVSLTLNGPGGSLSKRFEVTQDERYYAPLVAAATLQLLDEALQGVGAGTSEVAWEITLEDGAVVRSLEQISDPDDLAAVSAALVGAPLQLLAENVFQAPEVSRVAVNLSYSPEERYAELVKVVLEEKELEPGQGVIARVRLQPYRGEPTVRTLNLGLPPGLGGEVELRFWGGLTPPEDEEGERRDPGILSFGELLTAMRNQVQSSELVVETTLDGETVRLERLVLPFLVKGEESVTLQIAEEASEAPDEDAGKDADLRSDVTEEEAPSLPDPSPPLYP